MKKHRKLSLILSLVLAISAFSGSFSYSVSADDENCSSYELLSALELWGDYDENAIVSRGEFAHQMVSLFKLSKNDSDTGNMPYTDVSVDHPYYGDIKTLYQLGVVSYADNFYPDSNITSAQGMKIAVSLLGYDEYAKAKGGYPTGYFFVGRDLKLNALNNSSNYVTYKALSDAMCDILLAPVNEVSSFDNNGSLTFESSALMIKYYYNIDIIEGKITANRISGYLNEKDKCSEGYIKIGKETYEIADIPQTGNIEEYLGYNVKAFIKNESGKGKVIYFYADECEFLTLPASVDTTYNNFEITTYYDGNEEDYKLDKSFTVIYNGKAYSGYKKEDFAFCDGSITLIDNDENGSYDVVKINKVDYLLYDSVDTKNKIITDKNGNKFGPKNTKSLFLDKDIIYDCFYINDNGEEIKCDLDALISYNTMEVTISKDGKYIKMVGFSNYISGTITDIYDNSLIIDGKEYESTDYAKKFITHNIVNNNVKIYLTYDNKVIMVGGVADGNFQYGYLIKIVKQSPVEDHKAYILTELGEKKFFEFAKNVTLDGIPVQVNFENTSNELYKKLYDKYLIFKFTTNSQGKIDKINTAVTEGLYDMTSSYEDKLRQYYDGELTCRSSRNMLSFFPLIVPRSTVLFVVPTGVKTGSYTYSPEDFYIKGISEYSENDKLSCLVFDIKSNGDAGAMVIYENTSKNDLTAIPRDKAKAVVDRIVTGYDEEEGIATKKITLIQDNVFKTYYFTSALNSHYNDTKMDIGVGDYVGFNAMGNKITNIEVEFDYSKEWKVGEAIDSTLKNGETATVYYSVGTLFSYENYVIMVKDIDGKTKSYLVLDRHSIIPRYNKTTRSFDLVSIEDLRTIVNSSEEKADKIILRTRSGVPFEITAYEQ